jgi:glycosyltransferase 2 family protein
VSKDRKRLLLMIGLAVLATAAAVLLIGRAAHYAELLKRLRGASLAWLVVCAVGETVAYAGYIVCYQAMAQVSGGPRLTAPIVVRVVGLSFGAFSVATAIGGLSVDFWALREAGEPAALASARVIALETLRWAVLGVATCIAGIVVLLGGGHRVTWVVPVAWLVVVPLCFAGGLWVSAARRRERFSASSGGRLRGAMRVAVTALVYIRQLMVGPRGLRLQAIGGAALFWAGELLCAWAALRAFGTRVALAPLLLGYTTGYVSTGLPLPIGGSGGVDAAMTGGFVIAGASLSAALLGAIAFRVFSFWIPALAALLSVITVRGLRDRLREVADHRRQQGLILGPQTAPGSPSRHPQV